MMYANLMQSLLLKTYDVTYKIELKESAMLRVDSRNLDLVNRGVSSFLAAAILPRTI